MKSKTKQTLGMKYQDKYVIGKDGNVKLDTAGHPVRRINSYFTADVKKKNWVHYMQEGLKSMWKKKEVNER